MKKITAILIGLMAFSLVGIAQPVDGDFGLDRTYKLESGDSYQKMIGADDTGFYVLRVDYQNDVWLEYWNGDNLTPESKNRLIFPSVSGIQAEFLEMYYLYNSYQRIPEAENPVHAGSEQNRKNRW